MHGIDQTYSDWMTQCLNEFIFPCDSTSNWFQREERLLIGQQKRWFHRATNVWLDGEGEHSEIECTVNLHLAICLGSMEGNQYCRLLLGRGNWFHMNMLSGQFHRHCRNWQQMTHILFLSKKGGGLVPEFSFQISLGNIIWEAPKRKACLGNFKQQHKLHRVHIFLYGLTERSKQFNKFPRSCIVFPIKIASKLAESFCFFFHALFVWKFMVSCCPQGIALPRGAGTLVVLTHLRTDCPTVFVSFHTRDTCGRGVVWCWKKWVSSDSCE